MARKGRAPTIARESVAGRPPTREERAAAGKALRDAVPRVSHGDWRPSPDRPDPLAVLETQNATRLPEYVPVRMGRMVASPFAFLRGAAAIQAADLAGTPVTGLAVQADGDAHVLNFGVFGTQERNLVFGLNDFDETLEGPWEWDLKRLAASAVVAMRFIGGREDQAVDAARAAVRSYREHMREYAELGNLELWYAQVRSDAILAVLSPETRKRAEAILASARRRTNLQVLDKTTELIDGDFRIVEDPPLIVRPPARSGDRAVEEVLAEWLAAYRSTLVADRRRLLDKYRLIDAVRKVVGVGSVGTRCFVILLRGEDERDPLFLQVKEAQTSVLEMYGGRPRYRNHGRRVVEGQRLIQPAPDIFLGWGDITMANGYLLQFYVRQLRDMKGSVTVDPAVNRPGGVIEYSALCGWALALAHARSGDAATISGYLGSGDTFDEAMGRYAVAYGDQTEKDHAALAAAVKSGRVAAEMGV